MSPNSVIRRMLMPETRQTRSHAHKCKQMELRSSLAEEWNRMTRNNVAPRSRHTKIFQANQITCIVYLMNKNYYVLVCVSPFRFPSTHIIAILSCALCVPSEHQTTYRSPVTLLIYFYFTCQLSSFHRSLCVFILCCFVRSVGHYIAFATNNECMALMALTMWTLDITVVVVVKWRWEGPQYLR